MSKLNDEIEQHMERLIGTQKFLLSIAQRPFAAIIARLPEPEEDPAEFAVAAMNAIQDAGEKLKNLGLALINFEKALMLETRAGPAKPTANGQRINGDALHPAASPIDLREELLP
jgi:hypothetical protein